MSVRSLVVAVLVVLVGCAAACTKRNPDACCTNAVECEQIGFDDITPCEDLRVCVGGHCVAPECTTSAECGPAAPYCVGQICTASCPDDSVCPADSPVCDPSGACRPCGDDAECASGICLAAEGVCAAETDAVFVSMAGADAGECTSAAPCLTMPYGLQRITAQRRVLRIVSLDYVIPDGVTIAQDVYIDGNNTRIRRTSTGPIVTFTGSAGLKLEGIRVDTAVLGPALEVLGGATVTAFAVDVRNAEQAFRVNGATLRISESRFEITALQCAAAGTLDVRRSTFLASTVSGSSCGATISRNTFDRGSATMIALTAGPSLIENNLLTLDTGDEASFMFFDGFGEATVQFNTLVRTASVPHSLQEVVCNSNARTLSSNIIVTRSSTPIVGSCIVDHSLFDSAAGTIAGAGNITANYDAVFVDPAANDFEPNASSGALGAADPTRAISEDLTGRLRPLPAGSVSDVGAFEVP